MRRVQRTWDSNEVSEGDEIERILNSSNKGKEDDSCTARDTLEVTLAGELKVGCETTLPLGDGVLAEANGGARGAKGGRRLLKP